MPLKAPTNKNYLRVSHGRICKTVDAGTPEAVPRVTKKGETVHELIWESASGLLDAIDFRDHPEYGKSWTLTIIDGIDTYGLQVHEDSRYGIELLKKIPNLFHGKFYTFRPYEFERDGKVRAGIAIEDEQKNKIQSYYQEFKDLGEGKWEVKDLYGFPKFEGDKADKDDLKIYFVKLAKWLRANAMKHLSPSGNFYREQPPLAAPEEPKEPATDDLPF